MSDSVIRALFRHCLLNFNVVSLRAFAIFIVLVCISCLLTVDVGVLDDIVLVAEVVVRHENAADERDDGDSCGGNEQRQNSLVVAGDGRRSQGRIVRYCVH